MRGKLKMECPIKCNKVSAVIMSVLLVGAGAFTGSQLVQPVQIEKVVNHTVEVPVEVVKQVEVVKEVPVVKEVLVDNGYLKTVLQHIYDNDGNVEYLTEDLKDSEVSLIAQRVVFVDYLKALAVKAVDAKGIKELDHEVVNGTTIDDRDVEKFKIQSDSVDVVVNDINFEDKDAELEVQAKFYHDDVKYLATFTVEVRDGEVEDVVVEDVEQI